MKKNAIHTSRSGGPKAVPSPIIFSPRWAKGRKAISALSLLQQYDTFSFDCAEHRVQPGYKLFMLWLEVNRGK
jgi:hypothetical protein